MNRNKGFMGMCLRRIFGETPIIQTINCISSRQIMALTSYFTLRCLVCAPKFITMMIVEMVELL